MKNIFGKDFEFGWHADKAASNLKNHKVDFRAVEEFDFDSCDTEEDNRRDYGEDRYVALGKIGQRVHVLVFTLRNMNRDVGLFWVISLRKANEREIDRYEESQENRE